MSMKKTKKDIQGELESDKNYLNTYPKKFFDLLESAKDIDMEIPDELEYDKEDIIL